MAHTTTVLVKVCKRCGVEKPLSAFGRHPTSLHGVRPDCRPCRRDFEKVRRNHPANIELSRASRRRSVMKYRYGLTPCAYERFLQEQGNKCAICGAPDAPGMGRLCVDHEHATGRLRGLLCRSCNCALGYLKDNPVLLRLAAEYLESR